MKIAEQDSRVRLHYSIQLGGDVVESTAPDEPLEFITGREEVIPLLERKVVGLEPGARTGFDAGPDEAFGPRDSDAVRVVDRKELFDGGAGLEPGMIFRIRDDDGNSLVVTVAAVDADNVVFDLNHPLAGARVRFEVEIIAVEPV